MHVFTGLDPVSNDANFYAAVDALARGLWALPAPRSLCELWLDEEDYAWLRQWARALHRSDAYRWLGMVPLRDAVPSVPGLVRREALGLLLLLLASEVARREATEGSVWPVLPTCFNDETRKLLIGTGHPTTEMKEALEAAARRFGLRQVFGVAGVQGYYLSVYLQFGFTEQGIERLPWWLAGYGEVDAVRELLDGTQRSRSFGELWQALRDYRHELRGEAELRRILARSPWVLPAWADALVRAARHRRDLAPVHEERGEAVPGVFLTQPLLRWDGSGEPRFVCRIGDLEPLGLTADRYDLRLGAGPVAILIQQEDGRYAHPEEIEFAALAPEVIASLAVPGEAPVACCELQLWGALDDVVIFDYPHGRRLDMMSTISPERDYLMLTPSDVALEPDPACWRLLAGGSYRLSLLQRGWSPDLQALLEGLLLWTPAARHTRQQVMPEWAGRIVVSAPRHAWLGETIDVRLGGLPEDARLVSVRVGTRPMRFSCEGTHASLDPIEVTPDLAISGLRLVLRLRYEARAVRVEKMADMEICGVVRLEEGQWRVVEPAAQITVAQAKQIPHRFFLPSKWTGEARETLALMEGDTFSSRLPLLSRPLGSLGGFGGELCVRPGPYNEEAPVLRVTSAVVDPGQLAAAASLLGRALVLTLDAPREPSEHHQVLCWQPGQAPRHYPGRAIAPFGKDMWSVQTASGIDPGAVIALGYQGYRVGACWPPRLAALLAPSTRPDDDDRTKAALIRWARLPILAQPYRGEVCRLIERSPLDVALAWLGDGGLLAGLHHATIDEPWRAVVRQLLWQWHPNPAQARALLAELGRGQKYPLLAAAPRIIAVSPLLLGLLADAWLQIHTSNEERKRELQVLRELKAGLLGVDRRAGPAVASAGPCMLETLARLMGIDSRFLELRLLRPALTTLASGIPLHSRDHENLQIALGFDAFRVHLAALVIDQQLQLASGGRR